MLTHWLMVPHQLSQPRHHGAGHKVPPPASIRRTPLPSDRSGSLWHCTYWMIDRRFFRLGARTTTEEVVAHWLHTFDDLQGCLTVSSLEPTRIVAAEAAKLGSLASELVFLKQGGRVLTKRGLEVHSLLHAAWAPEGQMAPTVDITRFPDFAHASPKLYTLRAGDTL
jgi:hypothetical protein